MGDRMTKLLGTATNSRAPHPWTDRPDEEIEWMRAHARGLRRHENMAKWAAKYERVVWHIENVEAQAKEQHDIVARIWERFGSPTYEELGGQSIYDLIDDLIADRTDWRARYWQLRRMLEHIVEAKGEDAATRMRSIAKDALAGKAYAERG